MKELLGRRFIIPNQCPICGKAIVVTVTQTVEEGGFDLVDMIEMTCISEPHWNTPESDEFMQTHFSTPYMDWVPIQNDVKHAVNKKVMKEHGLAWSDEFETWYDPKEPSDNPYDVNW